MLPPDQKKMQTHQAADATPDHPGLRPQLDIEVASSGPPAAVSAPPNLGTLLHALRRCWKWALPLAALAGLLSACAALFLYPGAYTSFVVLRILVRPMHGAQEDEGHFRNVQNAQIALMKSHDVLTEAIRESQVVEKYGVNYTPQTLAKKLAVQFNDGPEIMQVLLSDENPQAVAAVLNAIGDAYPKKIAAMEEARVNARIAQLRRRLVDGGQRKPGQPLTLAEQLFDKRLDLREAEREAGLDDAATVALKHQNAMSALNSARERLVSLKEELQALEAKLAVKQERQRNPLPVSMSEADLEDALANNRNYQDALKTIDECQARIAALKRRYTGAALNEYADEPRKTLDEWETYRRGLVVSTRNKLVARLETKASEDLRKELEDLQEREVTVKRSIKSQEGVVLRRSKEEQDLKAGGPKAPPEVEALRDQVRQLEAEYNTVGGQVAALEGSLPLPPRVTRHAEAFVPVERDTNRSQKIAIAVGVLMFMGVMVSLCLLEAMGKRIYSSNDVTQGLGLRVVGTLPRLPASARNKSAQAQALGGLDTRFGLNEAVDAIRTVLMHNPRNDGARVIVVTSAIGAEGKTSLASLLAASLSRAWRKTLLIDGDLRKPALNNQFDLPLEPGLSEALRGEIEFDDCIKPTLISRLWLMSAGKVDGHSLQALAQEGLGNVFDRLKEQYDFIVIDTSPVLLVPDGLLLAQQGDTVLLSVMKDHSRIPAVYAAQQRLEALGIHVLGTVMIGERTEAYGHAVPYPRPA